MPKALPQGVPVDYRPTSAGAPGVSLGWEKAPGDDKVAREVVAFLKDQRMPFSRRHHEDELECVASAIKSRAFLTEELANAGVGESLGDSLRAMRAALRTFVDAGRDARNFRGNSGRATDIFSRALETLQALVGLHLATIVDQYAIRIEPELAEILSKVPVDKRY
jgi:hypothetical protein